MIQSDVDFSEMTALNLDEYVGLAPTDPQSYHYFMEEQLSFTIIISIINFHLFFSILV